MKSNGRDIEEYESSETALAHEVGKSMTRGTRMIRLHLRIRQTNNKLTNMEQKSTRGKVNAWAGQPCSDVSSTVTTGPVSSHKRHAQRQTVAAFLGVYTQLRQWRGIVAVLH